MNAYTAASEVECLRRSVRANELLLRRLHVECDRWRARALEAEVQLGLGVNMDAFAALPRAEHITSPSSPDGLFGF